MHEPTMKMTPMYDSLNTQLYSGKAHSPIALDLTDNDKDLPYFSAMGNGHYAKADFFVLGKNVVLTSKVMEKEMTKLIDLTPSFCQLVEDSLLSKNLKEKYIDILEHRSKLMQVDK